MREEFSVVEFYDNGSHAYVERWLDAERAVILAKVLTHDAGNNVNRIIITDGGDDCVFEWKRGEGITWPTGKSEE